MQAGRPKNALLQSLADEDWSRLQAELQTITLNGREVLAEMGDPVDWVTFPETGLISIISILESGAEVETSIVGREGAVGFVEALGSGTMHSRLLVQIPGDAYRIRATAFRSAFRESHEMQRAVHQQVELLQAESRLAIACHTLHPVEARLCRWLLECRDLSGTSAPMPLSQELLAVMLAVRRTTVTRFASTLQAKGLIRYTRGMIEIIDSAGVERRACECRATLEELRGEMAPQTFSRDKGSKAAI